MRTLTDTVSSAEANKGLIADYLQALSGKAKTPEIFGEYVADEALAKHILDTEAAFPNYELLTQEIISEGDLVVVRGEIRGVHNGPFAHIEATGTSVSCGLIIIYKLQNRKIVNHWMQFDMFSLAQQLQNPQLNIALIQRQLEAFGRLDIDALVDNCTSDCEINSPGPEIIPYSGTMKGHAEIRVYFEKLLDTQENANLSIDQFLAQGNTVVGISRYSAQVKLTGKTINTPLTLSFKIRGDKIAGYTALGDSAAVAAAYAQTAAAAS